MTPLIITEKFVDIIFPLTYYPFAKYYLALYNMKNQWK